MTQIPDSVVDLIADIGTEVDYHDDNGPGTVECHACGAFTKMRWKHGGRLDTPEDVPHLESCPALWARKVIAER